MTEARGSSKAVPEIDGATLKQGDVLTDFRGVRWTFVRWEGHKIVVTNRESISTFYAGVFNVRDPRLPVEDES